MLGLLGMFSITIGMLRVSGVFRESVTQSIRRSRPQAIVLGGARGRPGFVLIFSLELRPIAVPIVGIWGLVGGSIMLSDAIRAFRVMRRVPAIGPGRRPDRLIGSGGRRCVRGGRAGRRFGRRCVGSRGRCLAGYRRRRARGRGRWWRGRRGRVVRTGRHDERHRRPDRDPRPGLGVRADDRPRRDRRIRGAGGGPDPQAGRRDRDDGIRLGRPDDVRHDRRGRGPWRPSA